MRTLQMPCFASVAERSSWSGSGEAKMVKGRRRSVKNVRCIVAVDEWRREVLVRLWLRWRFDVVCGKRSDL